MERMMKRLSVKIWAGIFGVFFAIVICLARVQRGSSFAR